MLADIVQSELVTSVLGALIAVAAAVIVVLVVALVFRIAAKRRHWAGQLIDTARRPFRAALVVCFVWASLGITVTDPQASSAIGLVMRILAIVTIAWLVGAVIVFLENLGLARYRIDTPDNRVARRVRTQVLILKRLSIVVVVVVALGAVLLSFPGAQTFGASLLASAGLLSIIAGLAVQSSLSNVFSGMQLAFSDAIRVDDVVIVEEEWGRVEEITLTYVVVHIWDDRRMILPSTYFTSRPYQNWTRRNSELLGSVEFDLDWRVTPQHMREELDRVLSRTPLWDKRVSVLQVTDAVGGYVRIRILVSAVDAPALFDLRCFVREELVTWLHEQSPVSLPRVRVQDTAAADMRRPSLDPEPNPGTGGLFSGDPEAENRKSLFTGRIDVVRPAEPE
ncbi:mechanosensitive ion channel protein MscS [Agreia sp. Leaf244]|uniref:mechanosensitive ion channel family protein n=1 Tax=Agreia sp. Leaf244 TaxID=1736305 RepID=UPI0006F830E1|nr:mechanosensitive ion channel domain-containing protein [Agreia sp. Leaf244]KQO05797.1 mechanosensitive ion channel protein MscS [Agreia sp. Leaf244]